MAWFGLSGSGRRFAAGWLMGWLAYGQSRLNDYKRQMMVKAALMAAGLLMLTITLGFLALAFFFWLSYYYPLPIAAIDTALLFLILGFGLFMLARNK